MRITLQVPFFTAEVDNQQAVMSLPVGLMSGLSTAGTTPSSRGVWVLKFVCIFQFLFARLKHNHTLRRDHYAHEALYLRRKWTTNRL